VSCVTSATKQLRKDAANRASGPVRFAELNDPPLAKSHFRQRLAFEEDSYFCRCRPPMAELQAYARLFANRL